LAVFLPIGIKISGKEYVFVSFNDVTEKNKSQEELKKSYEKLKEFDELKTEFLSMTSHELKTPLTPIKSQLQRIMSKELPKDELKEALKMISRNTNRLEGLINEVLELSRLQSKKFILVKKSSRIKEVVSNVVNTMSSLAEDRHINIKVKLAKLPDIQIDKNRVEQVLINLMDNAIRHGRPKNIDIIAKKTGNFIKLCVHDDGKGISEEDKPHLFELFYQGKEVRGLHIGVGLGLSIAKSITEAHGGSINFKSQLNKGTEFCLFLPVKSKRLKTDKAYKLQERGISER